MTIKDLDNVPASFGVYLWKDSSDNVIYIGKANNLKSRMKQYFQGSINSYKTHQLMQEIASYQIYIVKNTKEALVLESKLIKQHRPKYNILLMDDKGYPYIKISLNKKLEIELKWNVSKQKNSRYYGPFPSGYGAKELIKFLESEFLYENGLPIISDNEQYWRKSFEKIKNILAFKDKNYLKELEQKMYKASHELKFEIAGATKNFLTYLSKMQETQNIELLDKKNMDVLAVIKRENLLIIFISFYRYGVLLSFTEKIIESKFNINLALQEFLNQHYARNFIPERIILDHQFSNFEFELNFEVILEFPQKGELKKILEIAKLNLQNDLDKKEQNFIKKKTLVGDNISELKKLLNLTKLKTIILIDNSHTANSYPVSVIVGYVNGIKERSLYRKFKIEQSLGRNADVEYMAQGFQKFLKIKDQINPDLILVDGGLAQIHEIKKILKSQSISLPVAGLVKNEKHTTKYLLNVQEQRVELSRNLLLFLREMQDEVDRYAKSIHRKKRLFSSLEGTLSEIPGIGSQKEKLLLHHFNNHSAIYNATIEELTKVVGASIAKKIKEKIQN